jgi:NAD(P)-dependent dehydrogenase (short-subunit alcohol dehydrogenase family)
MTTPNSAPVALITGGTTGIGLATARVLHERGYGVLVTGRNPETLAAAKRALPEDVVVFRADASSIADAEAVAAELRERFGKLDLAFLNAGVAPIVALDDLDEQTYDQIFDVNIKGQVFTLQKVLPLLGKGSSVVLNCSVITEKALPGQAIYAATKGAQLALVRTLAADLAPRGIRVNAVSPGPIDTPAWTKLDFPPEDLPGMKDALAAKVPLGRIGEAEEIAHMVAFLASPEASYITAANMMVDGGFAVS